MKHAADRLLGDLLGHVVLRIFDAMGIAEEEITAARTRHGVEKAAAINGVFTALLPSPILRGKAPMLYRAHARELCDRAAMGVPLAAGTKAEVLAGLLDTSLTAPLRTEGLALAERLMHELFPDEAARLGAPLGCEQYAGQLNEDFAEAQRRLQQNRG